MEDHEIKTLREAFSEVCGPDIHFTTAALLASDGPFERIEVGYTNDFGPGSIETRIERDYEGNLRANDLKTAGRNAARSARDHTEKKSAERRTEEAAKVQKAKEASEDWAIKEAKTLVDGWLRREQWEIDGAISKNARQSLINDIALMLRAKAPKRGRPPKDKAA